MKILIVSNSEALRASLVRALSALKDDVQVIRANHEDALEMFLEKEPERVVVCEYGEKGTGTEEWDIGRTTYRDIKSSADEGVTVIRMGVFKYDYEDYIKAPFQLLELLKKLQ